MPIIDFILHIDKHLVFIVNQCGNWSYLILFLIIFIETGLVIFPFLPGDSLIFAASALAANPRYGLNVFLVYFTVVLGAILGDSLNYELGVQSSKASTKISFINKLINQKKRAAAENFFDKHGPITIALGRFIPFIRTFIPFISGASQMHYGKFTKYNILGGVLWTGLFTVVGYFFGNITFVKTHFSLLILGIILISTVPLLLVSLLNYYKNKSGSQ